MLVPCVLRVNGAFSCMLFLMLVMVEVSVIVPLDSPGCAPCWGCLGAWLESFAVFVGVVVVLFKDVSSCVCSS